MLYLLGLGLDVDTISTYGLKIVKRCKRVYLEKYTVDFPYSFEELEENLGVKVKHADREFVESLEIIDEARKIDVALLIYGNPLTATTHITLLNEAIKSGVKCEVVHGASVIDAVSETGLQLYKFGKIASMPGFEASSYIEVIKENQNINAHTLILVDIGLDYDKALEKLILDSENKGIKIESMAVCSRLGTTKSRIYYGRLKDLEDAKVRKPFCFIIPGKMHFLEKEFLDGFGR